MNEIRISFDQQTAVRISDGLRLKAVPDSGYGRCVACEAGDHRSITGRVWTCSARWASDPLIRCCGKTARKDGRNVTWRPA